MARLSGLAALLGAALLCALSASEAQASGFAIRENSAEALGTAFAGNASSATFLSTIFNNPAGMTEFTGDRAQLDASLILPSARFEGTSTQQCAFTCPLPTPVSGVGSGNAGQAAFVPAAYILHSFSDDLKVGFALTVPFGLENKYPDAWVGRYFGIKSELQTLDLNPNIAYRVTPWLSVGAGFSAQYAYAELSNAIDFSNPLHIPLPDGLARLHGSDWGFGGNAGILLKPLDSTNIGLTYRSRVDHTISGDLNVSTFLGTTIRSATAKLTTPDSVDLSVTHKLTDKLRIAGDLQWTHWSVFQNLTVTSGGVVASSTPENFRDTWFASVGATYNWDDNWTFRVGVAYDETPVRGNFITVRLPDSDRYWIAFGAGYKFSDGFSVDLGVAHIIMPSASLNSSVNSTILSPAGTGTVDRIRGKFNNMVDLISLQTRFRF